MPSPSDWQLAPPKERVKEGYYVAVCTEVGQPRARRSGYKLEMVFTLAGGPYATCSDALRAHRVANGRLNSPTGPTGIEVPYFCNCSPDRKIGRRSNLYRVVNVALDGSVDPNADVAPDRVVLGLAFVVRVGDVTADWRRQPLRDDLIYSVVREVLARVSKGPNERKEEGIGGPGEEDGSDPPPW